MQDKQRPSKLLALIALVIAIVLPFILVKTFHHKNRTSTTHTAITLPQPLPSPPHHASEPKHNAWQAIITKEGDSLAQIFKKNGLSAENLIQVIEGNPHADLLSKLKPGKTLQLLIKDNRLEKLIIPFTATQFLEVSHDSSGYTSSIHSQKMSSHNHYLTATVKGSLYATAKNVNIPYQLIRQMTELFSWDIDFSKDVREGDQFTIIYKAFYIEDKLVGTGDIVAVSYTNRARKFQAIRHTTANGEHHYYSATGESLKKAFSRYPVNFSHISSTFSLNRYHPILKKKRPHKGVDLAAPLGTPIKATGDGRIAVIERHSGYGNVIKIKHNRSYVTVYAHMLRFQKGLSKGSYVKKGQVIGYVGQTGLATGPHCHYEFHINRQPKNPTLIDLPRAAPVPAKELAAFQAKSSTLLAQLNLYENANIMDRKNQKNLFG